VAPAPSLPTWPEPAVTPAGTIPWLKVTGGTTPPANGADGALASGSNWTAIFELLDRDAKLQSLKAKVTPQAVENLLRTPGRPLFDFPN
jgi:hypothetical protein